MKNDELFCKYTILPIVSPLVMGILNLTPDSFYADSRILDESALINQTSKMVSEGAEIVDIGGCSTRPGAKVITCKEELNRVIPAIKIVTKSFPDIPISVDTFRAEVAEAAIKAGAVIINDISGGTFDSNMFTVIARYKPIFIMMHTPEMPETMQHNPQYGAVVEEVFSFFKQQLERLKAAGGDTSRVWIDPGFGFGKDDTHNYQLLASLSHFKKLNCPILVGISRKSMINRILNCSPNEALNGTTVLNTLALKEGANILRVHDVKAAHETILLFQQYNQFC